MKELKAALEAKGLSTKGRKPELEQRLADAEPAPPDPAAGATVPPAAVGNHEAEAARNDGSKMVQVSAHAAESSRVLTAYVHYSRTTLMRPRSTSAKLLLLVERLHLHHLRFSQCWALARKK